MKRNKMIEFDGLAVPVVPMSKELGTCIGDAKTGNHRKSHEMVGQLSGVYYEKTGSFSKWWWKPVGAVADSGQYVRVMKRRILPILLIILLAACVLNLIGILMTGQDTAKNTVNYIGEKAHVTEPNKDVKGVIDEYSSFESVPENITWTANSAEQNILLKNLDGNTVDLAPQIYVDLNRDGSFADDECVFNSDCGKRLQPGKSADSITLEKDVPAGTYKAEVVYRAFDGPDTPVNGMNFDFTVNVK